MKEKLAALKESMDPAQIGEIVEETHALLEYQETPDSKEALETIPLLKREDIRKEAEPLINDIRSMGDTTVMYHDIFTNHISYLRFLFDVGQVPEDLFPYIGILKSVLGYVDTETSLTGSCSMKSTWRPAVSFRSPISSPMRRNFPNAESPLK